LDIPCWIFDIRFVLSFIIGHSLFDIGHSLFGGGMTSELDKKRTMRNEVAKGLGVLALLVLLMVWLAGAFVKKIEPGPATPRTEAPRLSTQKVQRQVYPLLLAQMGTVRARTEAMVSSRIMAQVKDILVKEGETVLGSEEKGSVVTVLALLQDADIKARLLQAEAQSEALERGIEAARARLGAARAQVEGAHANREKALTDYRRSEDLRRNEAATGQQVEHAKAQKDSAEATYLAAIQEVRAGESEVKRLQAQRDQAEAAVAEARIMLGYTVIRAPFTGKVVRKLVNIGDMASPAQPLFMLETASHMELHAFLSESLIPRIALGQELEVRIDALDRTFPGVVREIVPKSDPTTRTVSVKVTLPPDAGLVNGLFGRLSVPYGTYEALVVPRQTVREVGQLMLVEVVGSDGHPQRRFVTLGQAHDGLVEVLSGLQENEAVVVP
jgi:multidrug efflux pump subunit AcrA (membrane-fusion protein)